MATQGAYKRDFLTHANDTNCRTPYCDDELEYFRQLILRKMREATEEIERLRTQLLEDDRDQLDNDSIYSFHMADGATDTMDRERIYLMIDRQQRLLWYLERALERIKNKTYGVCRVTGQRIPKERLEAIPHTEISVAAKIQEQRRWR